MFIHQTRCLSASLSPTHSEWNGENVKRCEVDSGKNIMMENVSACAGQSQKLCGCTQTLSRSLVLKWVSHSSYENQLLPARFSTVYKAFPHDRYHYIWTSAEWRSPHLTWLLEFKSLQAWGLEPIWTPKGCRWQDGRALASSTSQKSTPRPTRYSQQVRQTGKPHSSSSPSTAKYKSCKKSKSEENHLRHHTNR